MDDSPEGGPGGTTIALLATVLAVVAVMAAMIMWSGRAGQLVPTMQKPLAMAPADSARG